MSEDKVVGITMHATIGVAVPNVMPVRKYDVRASGRCRVCDAEIIILDVGAFHLKGDEVDESVDHPPKMAYRDLFRETVMATMAPFLGNVAINPLNMEMMRKKVEEACHSHLRCCVGISPNHPELPAVETFFSPPDQVNFVFKPEDFTPYQ